MPFFIQTSKFFSQPTNSTAFNVLQLYMYLYRMEYVHFNRERITIYVLYDLKPLPYLRTNVKHLEK